MPVTHSSTVAHRPTPETFSLWGLIEDGAFIHKARQSKVASVDRNEHTLGFFFVVFFLWRVS